MTLHFSLLNLVSALAIGGVITGLAAIREVRLKALLYVLPIPISIGLIATHGHVSGANIIGLGLIWGFLLLTWYLIDRLRLPVLLADVLASVAYVIIGYGLIRLVRLPFWALTCLFVIMWALLTMYYHRHLTAEKVPKPSALPPILKGSGASAIAFVLFTLKDLLAGVVVTFPFNGVFAVIEVRRHLEQFVRSVIRNSLAIGALFVSMYYLQSRLSFAINLLMGWIAFTIVLTIVNRIAV